MKTSARGFSYFQLRWNEKLGLKECPYLVRWVLTFFGYSLRLHYWKASDDQRNLHDHPWWMVIVCLKGSYQDISGNSIDTVRPFSIRFRKASHKHTVNILSSPCITLLLTGRPVRKWGFYDKNGKFMRTSVYFRKYGHHPCEEGE